MILSIETITFVPLVRARLWNELVWFHLFLPLGISRRLVRLLSLLAWPTNVERDGKGHRQVSPPYWSYFEETMISAALPYLPGWWSGFMAFTFTPTHSGKDVLSVQDSVSRMVYSTPSDVIWNKMHILYSKNASPIHFIPYGVAWCPGHQILDRTPFPFLFHPPPLINENNDSVDTEFCRRAIDWHMMCFWIWSLFQHLLYQLNSFFSFFFFFNVFTLHSSTCQFIIHQTPRRLSS